MNRIVSVLAAALLFMSVAHAEEVTGTITLPFSFDASQLPAGRWEGTGALVTASEFTFVGRASAFS